MSTCDLMQLTHIPDGFACMLALQSAQSLWHRRNTAAVSEQGVRQGRAAWSGGAKAGGLRAVVHAAGRQPLRLLHGHQQRLCAPLAAAFADISTRSTVLWPLLRLRGLGLALCTRPAPTWYRRPVRRCGSREPTELSAWRVNVLRRKPPEQVDR